MQGLLFKLLLLSANLKPFLLKDSDFYRKQRWRAFTKKFTKAGQLFVLHTRNIVTGSKYTTLFKNNVLLLRNKHHLFSFKKITFDDIDGLLFVGIDSREGDEVLIIIQFHIFELDVAACYNLSENLVSNFQWSLHSAWKHRSMSKITGQPWDKQQCLFFNLGWPKGSMMLSHTPIISIYCWKYVTNKDL